jgi:HlyD family secretion protein
MNAVMAFLTGIVALVVPGFGASNEPVYAGYLDADYVYAAAVTPGTIADVQVREGQAVTAGDVLFVLDTAQQQALLAGAEARVRAADATWQNLLTGGRVEEVQVVRASLAKAEADLKLAQANFERSSRLHETGVIAASEADQNRAALNSAQALLAQYEAQLAVAELPAREAQQAAAEANSEAAKADADKARADLADRTIRAGVDGVIERLYFSAGEMAPVGTPLASIRPAGALKAKFYINEADRAGFAIGDAVTVSCDGCAEGGLAAHVSFLASSPQTTPPIIYSRDERSRLVFLAEATLEQPGTLLPGQPVSVRRAAK